MSNSMHDLTRESQEAPRPVRDEERRQMVGLIRLALDPQEAEEHVAPFADPDEWSDCLGEVSGLGVANAKGWVRAVLGSSPSVEALKTTRRHALDAVKRCFGPAERAAAELLYHAATAAAFVHHRVNIGQRRLDERRALYGRLAEQLETGPVAALLAAAARGIESTEPKHQINQEP